MNNEQRNPKEIEADIDQARANMNETLDEIQTSFVTWAIAGSSMPDFLGGKSTDNNNFTANLYRVGQTKSGTHDINWFGVRLVINA